LRAAGSYAMQHRAVIWKLLNENNGLPARETRA
jgi:hypothetical protein